MNKFQRSWLLLKSSLQVIFRNKKLLVFPVVIFTLTIAIILFFLSPVAFRPTGYSYTQPEHWKAIGNSLFTKSDTTQTTTYGTHHRTKGEFRITTGAAVYLTFMYFVSMFFATFFNVAFYHEILAALSGQTVSIGRGLLFACKRWRAILMWTLFAGLVGYLIRLIEERLPIVGQIIAGLVGLAWSIASVFVIPVIVREEGTANPLGLLKQSAYTLKRTWGEALIGYVGMSFANTIVFLGSFFCLIAVAAISITLKNYWLLAGAGVLWILAMCTWSYVVNVASQVYKGALYLYAAEGLVPAPYDEETLNSAWKYRN